MDDEAAMRAKIDALKGQIAEHKQTFAHPPSYSGPSHFQVTRGSQRWTPYARGGRGGKPHKNRTLVVAGPQSGMVAGQGGDATGMSGPVASSPVNSTHISTRGAKVNQLMTKSVFEREQKQWQELQKIQRNVKRPKPDRRQSGDAQVAKVATQHRELEIEGIRFQLKDDGSKLVRIPDLANSGKETPRKAKIADVEFLRTKSGNLIRVAAQNGGPRITKRAPKAQCENFTKYGTCTFGPSCKFSHNPTKVAICKELLRNGECQSGKTCDMSHELTYHRVPACTHFIRGNCTNSACRYPHVHVSPTARVCHAFATLGFCAKGPDCDGRHVFECPDYANRGHCAALVTGSCSLQHVDRAGALRKAEKRQGMADPEDDSDMTSDEEYEKGEDYKQAAYESESDVDTDIEMESGGFEQQDFVALG